MMLLLSTLAAAGTWSGLRDTAGTLDAGEVVARLPTGTTAVGLTDTTELQVIPFELWTGGTRVGIEQTLLERDAFAVSLSPSVAEKWTLRRTAARLETHITTTGSRSRLTLTLGGELRLMRQEALSEVTTHALSIDRLHVPVALSADRMLSDDALVRTTLTVAALDEGVPLTYGTLTGGYIRRFGRLYADVGVGALLGSPSEHTFLGAYTHRLLLAYPRADVWVQF